MLAYIYIYITFSCVLNIRNILFEVSIKDCPAHKNNTGNSNQERQDFNNNDNT